MTINSIDDKYGKWLIPLIIAKHFLLHYFPKIKKMSANSSLFNNVIIYVVIVWYATFVSPFYSI